MSHLKYHLLLLVSTVIIAGSFISAQVLSTMVDPASLALMRFSLAALLLAPFVGLSEVRRQTFIRVLPKGFIISFFYAAFFLIMFKALKTTTTLNTGTLYTLVPFLIALVSIFLFWDKIRAGTLLVYLISTVVYWQPYCCRCRHPKRSGPSASSANHQVQRGWKDFTIKSMNSRTFWDCSLWKG
ncbi:EamA family transporter [Aeromonas veronii]|uniref:EamA family transporter n=1 Tax=Aeromonas veronii TaxID=654 RepID=UPI0032EB98FF